MERQNIRYTFSLILAVAIIITVFILKMGITGFAAITDNSIQPEIARPTAVILEDVYIISILIAVIVCGWFYFHGYRKHLKR